MATLFNTKIKDTYQSLLKLEDNTILTTTSKNITDGLGNASPLYLSTTQVRIGSNSASAMYWDNTNSRLGIGTSSPASILHTKGVGTTNATVNLRLDNSSNFPIFRVYDDGGINAIANPADNTGFDFNYSNKVSNSYIRLDGNTGGQFKFANNGISIGGGGVSILRSGNTRMSIDAGTTIIGSGSTSATNSLLVQNSSGTSMLTVRDDGRTSIGTGGITFQGSTISSNTTLNIGGVLDMQFNNTDLYFQAKTKLFCLGQPDNLTRSGFTLTGNFTNTGAGGSSTGNLFISEMQLNTSIGNVTLNHFSVANIVNTTAATTLQRGFYYNPTLTGTVGFTHRAIETVTGDVLFGTTSGKATFGSGVAGTSYIEIKPGISNGNNRITFNDFDGATSTRGGFIEISTYLAQINFGSYNPFYLGNSSKPYNFYMVAGLSNIIISTGNVIPTDSGALFQVKGSGSTSATTSLLVQNSAGTQNFAVNDAGNVLIGTTVDNGAKLRIEGGDLSMTGYQPTFILNGTVATRSYMKTNLAVEGTSVIGGIGLNTDNWLTGGSGNGGPSYNVGATIHLKVNGTNPLTSAPSHWLAGDGGKGVGYQFLTTHYRSSVPAAWYGPEISGGIVGLQQFNIGYEPKQYGGAGFTFVGVGLSGAITDPFTRTTEFNPIRIDYSLASGGSNITARGVYYNPTFTSVYPLLVNNAFESTSGSLVMSGTASRVSSGIGRGVYFNQTLRPANMSGDVLVGLDINPTFTSSATQISTFSYVSGSGYTVQNTWTNIPLTGGTGTGATVNITVGAGNVVTAVTMANRGTGYTVNDVLTLPAQNIFTHNAGGSGFSVTVTAVGASTYDTYGLLVRSGAVVIGGATGASSALVDMQSTTKGFLPPRVTTIQKNAISSPVAGLMVYDTDLARPCFFNGATWITL